MDGRKRDAEISENEEPPSKKMKKPSYSGDLLQSLLPFNTVTTQIFLCLSWQDMSRLCETSKYMCHHLFELMATESFGRKVALSILDKRENDISLKTECHGIAILSKKASWLFPMKTRMEFFFDLMQRIQLNVERHSPDFPKNVLLNCFGIMLHAFVAGWADNECEKICSYISARLQIDIRLNNFLSHDVGFHAPNENYLRLHIRHLFLDHCNGYPSKALWLHHCARFFNTSQLSKIILLLYGPTSSEGDIHWNFASESRSFEVYTSNYVLLANVINCLNFMPKWTQTHSLEVLIYVSNTPTCWLLRSFASLVIPLVSVNLDLALSYISILYNTGRINIASLLITLSMTVAPHFIENTTANDLEVTHYNVKRLISSVLSGTFPHGRSAAVSSMWNTIAKLAVDFADATLDMEVDEIYARQEFSDDFCRLLESWTGFVAEAMKER